MPDIEPKTEKVVVVTVHQLNDIGHSVNIAANVKEADGSVTQYSLPTTSSTEELRIELTDLQEVTIRPKVTGTVAYDHEQNAVLTSPGPDSPPPTSKHAKEKQEKHEEESKAPKASQGPAHR